MDIIKLSGFSQNNNAKDISNFLKASNVKNYKPYLGLGDSRKFSGVAFVVVKNKFDCSSILTLRNRRYQTSFIDVCRSSAEEMKKYNLYPQPEAYIYEIQTNNDPIHLDKIEHSRAPPTFNETPTPITPQPRNITTHSYDLSVDLTHPTVIKTSDVGDVLNDIEEFRQSLKSGKIASLKEYHYGYFVKIFYVDPEVTAEEIVEFVKQIATPLILFFGGFITGPHAGKNSNEVYVCFSCTMDALAALKLTNLTLGRYKIAVVFPTNLEIDNVIYNEVHEYITHQYQQNLNVMEPGVAYIDPGVPYMEPEPVKIETGNFGGNNYVGGKFCGNLPEVTPEPLNVQGSMATDALSSYESQNFNSRVKEVINQDVVCETLVLVKNVPVRVLKNDIIKFFYGVKINDASIRKLNHNKDSTEWVVSLRSYQEAVKAIKKHNYKLLKGKTIELVLMT